MNSAGKYVYKKLELNDESLKTLKAVKALINLDLVERRSYLNETLEKVKRHRTLVC